VSWCALLTLVIAVLIAAGHGPLALPARGTGWSQWVGTRDAITMVFVAVRVGALVLASYLLLVGVVTGVALGARSVRLVRLADWLTVPVVRTVVQSLLGLSLATATLTAPSPGASGWHPPAAVMELVPTHDRSPVVQSAVPPPPGAPQISRPDREHATTSRPTWTVQPGDHFWSIAARHLGDVFGEQPHQAAVTRYWRRLIDANRDRLRDPSNADLIYPGDVLRLPPVGRRPR
jgi:nucleoid-associated protein YgaU